MYTCMKTKEQKTNGKKKTREKKKSGGKNWSRNRGRKTHCALPVLPRRCPLFSMFPCNWKLVRGNVTCSRVILHVRFVSSLEHACSVSCSFSSRKACKEKKKKKRKKKWKTGGTSARRDETRRKTKFVSLCFFRFNPVYIYIYICMYVHIFCTYVHTYIYIYRNLFFQRKIAFFSIHFHRSRELLVWTVIRFRVYLVFQRTRSSRLIYI